MVKIEGPTRAVTVRLQTFKIHITRIRGQNGEPTGATRPRYRIIFSRRTFLSGFSGYDTSYERISLFNLMHHTYKF